MSSIGLKAVAGLALSAGFSLLLAASAAIGVATTDGNLFIDNAKTAGNATIFDGETVQTQLATQVRLKTGAFVNLSNESRGRIFSTYLELQRGSARLRGFSVTANGLRIHPESNATYSVEMKGPVVEVAAVSGNVHVFNAQGVNVANLVPGRALDLRPQEAAALTPSSLVGCVQKNGDVYTLTDETSNVTVQLIGANVQAGHRYQVTGTIPPNARPAGGATQVLNVSSARDVGGECRAPGAAAGGPGTGGMAGNAGGNAGGGGAAAAGAAAGGVNARTAVIAGVVVAAAIGAALGLAAAGIGSSAAGAPPGCTANGLSPCSSI